MNRRFLVHPIVLGLAAFAATPANAAADDAGVNALYGRLVVYETTQDVSKLDAIYTPDAVYLGPGRPPMVGRESIKTSWADIARARKPGGPIAAKFRLVQRIWHGRDSVTDIGYGKLSRTLDDGTQREAYSKFVTLALRQPDGSWRWRVDIDNSLPAETADAEFNALKPVGDLRYDK